MNKPFNFFAAVLIFTLGLASKVSAQTDCSCWQQRDTSFHYVPFLGCTPPYYRNDDSYTGAIQLPFNFCFWGQEMDSLFINNNGNITFGQSDGVYSPDTFPTNSAPPMIAPFWGDVYTIGGAPGTNVVLYKITPHYMIVQWDSVLAYSGENSSMTNSFQVIITDGTSPIIPPGNNVEFCYKQMQWTTGDASDGTDGFGGDPADVGANKGDGSTALQIGLFDSPTANYVGQYPPGSSYDGVYWLDNRSFLFNLCSGTIDPLSSGISPCDTIKICVTDSIIIPIYFLAPSVGDTDWSNLSGTLPPGVSVVGNYPGPTDSLHVKVVGTLYNYGPHTINVYAYDNAVPPDTTFTSFVVQIDSVNPTAVITAIKDTVCEGDTTTIAVTGVTNAGYKWSTNATTSSINVSPTVPTAYSVTVWACGTKKLTKTIQVYPRPVVKISGTPLKCKGQKDTLTASGGTTYLWSNGSTDSTYITHDINADSTFKVVGYALAGCGEDTAQITVKLRIPPVINFNIPIACEGTPVELKANAAGLGPFTYSWSPSEATTDSINIIDSNVTYTVSVTNGCVTTKTTTIVPYTPPLNACCDKLIFMGDDTILTASGATKYKWLNTGISCDTCPTITVSPTVTTTYTLTGTDSSGCSTQQVVTIMVELPCSNFTVPNVFTPNYAGSTGQDNKLYIKTTSGINAWSLLVYDRWGKEIFKSTSPTDYWDGTTEAGSQAPDGVYYYIIDASCEQGNTYKKDGFIQLIR